MNLYADIRQKVPIDDMDMDSHESSTFRASDSQEPRNDNGSTSRPKSIMPATQQNTAASAERFRLNSDSPLFKVGNKRQKEVDEEYRKQNEKRVHVNVRAIQLCDEFVC
jgi:hypothetical protein